MPEGALGSLSLADVERRAQALGVSVADVLAAVRGARPLEWQERVAQRLGLPFVDLRKEPPDPSLLRAELVPRYQREGLLPWRKESDGTILVAAADPGPAALLRARELVGSEARLVVATRIDISLALQTLFRSQLSLRAVYGLAESRPELSARYVLTRPQAIGFYVLVTAFFYGLAFAPLPTLVALFGLITLFYLGNFAFKAALVLAGARDSEREAIALEAEAALLTEGELPTYTILVPMFREAKVLPFIADSLRALDYPLEKLDIKLVLEEEDEETIDAARKLGLERAFEIVVVPKSHPQTKPKACNYALQFARGDILVIYDAEDRPEADQLRRVVATFRKAPAEVVCVQCRLNYFNADENWLTRLFTLDYSLWFDLLLAGLARLRIPIPLGGTSNHFRTDVLRQVEGWDPFNVTEDADLGIRLTQLGYEVVVIPSTTFEEANCRVGNWIRQRSRWIKGYMQTLLVHLRQPLTLVRRTGIGGVLGFVFFVGGTAVSGVLNPILWAIFAVWAVTQTSALDDVFFGWILWGSAFNLVLGNAFFVYLMALGAVPRRRFDLALWAALSPLYWILMSIAAWKALWQLIVRPHFWEKTEHGLSKMLNAQNPAPAGG